MGKKNRHVLIVDSETGTKVLLSELLKNNNILFTQVTNAKDAMKIKDANLIILDLKLDGETSGNQLITKIRKRSDMKDIPIIILTSKATLNDRAVAMEAGGDEYLIKPFNVTQLENRVMALLENGRGNLE